MPYVYFTQEERQRARMTDLAAFLRERGESIHRSGSEHMWLCSGQKVTLRGNLWFHHYTQTGGDAVEFVCRFYHLDYPDAVKLLLQSGVPCAETIPEIYPQRQLVLPRRNENMRRVSAYLLRQRGIDQEVLDISYEVCSSERIATRTFYGNRFVKGRLPWSYTFFFFELLSRRLSPRP